jgi:hypothetical protein
MLFEGRVLGVLRTTEEGRARKNTNEGRDVQGSGLAGAFGVEPMGGPQRDWRKRTASVQMLLVEGAQCSNGSIEKPKGISREFATLKPSKMQKHAGMK